MQIGLVVGHAIATVKHASMNGWKLLIVQPLAAAEKPDGEPLLVIDHLGACPEDRIILCNDGAGIRQMMGHKNAPVRWFNLGIRDAGGD